MNIEFLDPPALDRNDEVVVRAKIDGQIIICHFTQGALQGVNPHMNTLSSIEQYGTSELKLKAIAERLIRNGKIQKGQVHIGTNDVHL